MHAADGWDGLDGAIVVKGHGQRALIQKEGKQHKVAIRDQCRETRAALTLDAKARREALRDAIRTERVALRGSCQRRLAEARSSTNRAIEEARRTAVDLHKLKLIARTPAQAHAAEKARMRAAHSIKESDDEVRRNLPDDLARIWSKVKHKAGMRGSKNITRTERFLQWVHDNSATVGRMLAAEMDREPPEETESEYRARTARNKRKPSRSLEGVPF